MLSALVTKMHAARKADKGFSLVEMLAIVAVLVILAAVAAPSFQRTMEWYRLQSSANIIAAEMEAARVLAVSRGASYRMDFDSANNTVRVIDIEDPSNPPRALKQLEPGVSVVAPSTPIVFYPRGHATAVDAVRVSNTRGEQLQVAVLRSGKVTVGTAVAQTYVAGGTTTSGTTSGATSGTTTGATTGTTTGAATGSSTTLSTEY